MKLRTRSWSSCLLIAVVCSLLDVCCGQAQSDLQIVYGAQGVQRLTYRGQVLEDVDRYPADAFHIWHMKSTDLSGKKLISGQNGWGETNKNRTWNAASHTWTYQFTWGTITTQFVQHGDSLDLNVTETNNSGSGVLFSGATIYPMALHFPQLPAGFSNASYNQFAFNTTGPSITIADYGGGEVASVVTGASRPLYSGFQPANPGTTYTPIISSTVPDSLAAFQPHNDRTIAPGQTDHFTVSLRFAPAGTPASALAADAYAAWTTTWPAQLKWSDRRIIGTAYLASSAQGNQNQPAGYPNNPRRYFNTGNSGDFDIRTPRGLVQFQHRVLRQAAEIVTNLRRLKAQGAITWDIEGEQYPMNTSYVCSPDQIAAIAPEMESTISDNSSPYHGMKLDDAYFRTIHDAGFRVGLCVRPQNFVLNADSSAQQVTITKDTDVIRQLIRKMRYAHDRWGVTIFYIDSAVDAAGAPLDASVFQQVAAALPDSLLIPEESTPKHYAYTAPFRTFIFHGDLGTDPSIYNSYPSAFSANLINDVDSATLAAHRADLTASVKRGDVLMVHADSWNANNDTVLRLYADAVRASSAGRAVPASSRANGEVATPQH